MKLQKKILDAVAAVGMKTAVKAGGTASFFGVFQPKEPKLLKQTKN